MKELSVTDVQKALREHAQWGHDVTKSPRHSIVRDQSYGLRLGAMLQMPGDGSSSLYSYLMQAERPVVSGVHSHITGSSAHGGGLGHKRLQVHPMFPTVEKEHGHGDFPMSHFTRGRFNDKIKMSEKLHDYSEIIATEHGIEDPEGPLIPHNSSVHDALRSHKEDAFPHFGINVEWGSHTRESKFTPIPHGSQHDFKMSEAISHLIRPTEAGGDAGIVKPLSGLIIVSSPHPKLGYVMNAIHTYDPHTEELRRV